MVRLSRWLLILLTLIFGARPAFSADTRDADAFNLAMGTFRIAPELAEKDFTDFIRNYPNSVRKPEAIWYQAQAMLAAGRATNAIQSLTTYLASNPTNKLEPQFLYTLGLAYFQNTNNLAAAETFGRMVDKYPSAQQALDATIRQADAFARLGHWAQLVETLTRTNGLFQKSVREGAVTGTIASGYLLLGEAQLAQGNNAGVEGTLHSLEAVSLNTQLKWQRDYLLSRLQRAEGNLEDAYQTSANLIGTQQDRTNRAEGVSFQGALLEQMGNLGGAADVYTNNLAPDVPPDQQRHAILKIAELDLKLPDKLPDAVANLTKYLSRTPPPESADIALLTLGEVRLKQALNGQTNLFDNAISQFANLTNSYPNSPVVGKALLSLGWCLWSQGKIADSQQVFRGAVDRLPFSEEQAEARFKWADTQFAARDFAGAITNYNAIAEKYISLPGAKENHLIERALYQSCRAALNQHDLVAARSALKNIVALYPNGFAGPSALLLTGQGLAEQNDPAGARELFEEFEKLYPENQLLSEVRLAVARTYEVEGKWDAAITNYVDWTGSFTNHLMAQAQFRLAWDQYMAGHETNALNLFTNFIARFPTNELSSRAQFWIGDYYSRQGDWSAAEINYQLVFQNTNWPVSELTYEARMRAGQSATKQVNYKQAIVYFSSLLTPDCPPALRVRATFAYADSTINQDSTNKTADINEAINSLQTIVQTHSNRVESALAWGMIGNCYFELGAKNPSQYASAEMAYTNVINTPAASSATRYEALFKLGATLEKQAALKTGDDQTGLMKEALHQYLIAMDDAAFKEAVNNPDGPSALWTKRSGLAAALVAESLQEWDTAGRIYDKMKQLLPILAPYLDKKIAKINEHRYAQ
jgi:TolA-binding protein